LPPGTFAPAGQPLEPPGDHQMDHDEQLAIGALQNQHDALADPLYGR
jgi:hypothetical protein